MLHGASHALEYNHRQIKKKRGSMSKGITDEIGRLQGGTEVTQVVVGALLNQESSCESNA